MRRCPLLSIIVVVLLANSFGCGSHAGKPSDHSLLENASTESAAPMGGETQNGGYGVKVGDKIDSLDLVLRGIQDHPYLSETTVSRLTESEIASVRDTLGPVAGNDVIEIVLSKLSEIRSRTQELRIAYPVRHLTNTVQAYSWIMLPTLKCQDVEDDSSPVAGKVQVAYREKVWIRLCKDFFKLDAANQAALLTHELIYASMSNKSVTVDLVGYLFSPTFRDFTASGQAEFKYLMAQLIENSTPFPQESFFVQSTASQTLGNDLCFGTQAGVDSTEVLWRKENGSGCTDWEHLTTDRLQLNAQKDGHLFYGSSYPVGRMDPSTGALTELCDGSALGLCTVTLTPKLALNLLLPPQAQDTLLSAMQNGAQARLEYWLSRKVGLDSVDAQGQSPLSLAWSMGRTDVLKKLLAAGANPNTEWAGVPLIVRAVTANSLDLVNALVSAHADLNRTAGSDRLAPLTLAIRSGAVEIAQALIVGGADVNAQGDGFSLKLAIDAGQASLLRSAVGKGAELEREWCGTDPLLYAIEAKKPELALALLDLGAKPDHEVRQDFVRLGSSRPIEAAIQADEPRVVSRLIQAGADLTYRPWSGIDGLGGQVSLAVFAIQSSSIESFKLLIQAGAPIAEDRLLSIAIRLGRDEITRYVLEKMNPVLSRELSQPKFSALFYPNRENRRGVTVG